MSRLKHCHLVSHKLCFISGPAPAILLAFPRPIRHFHTPTQWSESGLLRPSKGNLRRASKRGQHCRSTMLKPSHHHPTGRCRQRRFSSSQSPQQVRMRCQTSQPSEFKCVHTFRCCACCTNIRRIAPRQPRPACCMVG